MLTETLIFIFIFEIWRERWSSSEEIKIVQFKRWGILNKDVTVKSIRVFCWLEICWEFSQIKFYYNYKGENEHTWMCNDWEVTKWTLWVEPSCRGDRHIDPSRGRLDYWELESRDQMGSWIYLVKLIIATNNYISYSETWK